MPTALGDGALLHWEYLGEGGANIVFRYRGDLPQLKSKVIRVRKFLSISNPEFPVATAQKYRLEAYIDDGIAVIIPKEALDLLLKRFEQDRPAWRLHPRAQPREQVLIFPNYHAPYADAEEFFSLEIKPKWHGALSRCGDAIPKASAVHRKYCRFCAHNYPGEPRPEDEDRYCPSDIFSRDVRRIRAAIDALCHEPRNNLKVFQRGRSIEPNTLPSAVRKVAADILARDPLLRTLQEALNAAWTSLRDADRWAGQKRTLLMEAVALRDCSVIVRLAFSMADLEVANVQSSIHLIDLDDKCDSKIAHYEAEAELFFKHWEELSTIIY